jgi:hypothetical protein
MCNQVIEPDRAFRHVGAMSCRNPPQDQRGLHRREPFFATGVEALMQRLPHEPLQRLHIFPHSQVR